MDSLRDAAVVVTGASSGIGLAVAERFVAAGARVLTGSRREAAIAGARWVRTDVADPAQADALVAAAVEAFGRVDVVVNNAGVQVEKTVADTTDEDFDYVMGVNVKGVFNVCRAAVRQMRAQPGGGVIVNVGSISGRVSDHGMAVYNTSKAAVHALTRSVAVDHGADGIRCNAVAAGLDSHSHGRLVLRSRCRPGRSPGSSRRASPRRPPGPSRGHRRPGALAGQRRGVVRLRKPLHHRRRPNRPNPHRSLIPPHLRALQDTGTIPAPCNCLKLLRP